MVKELYVQKLDGDTLYYTDGKTSKKLYSKIIKKTTVIKHRGVQYNYDRENNKINFVYASPAKALTPIEVPTIVNQPKISSEFSINKRFDFLIKFTEMVVHNITASLLLCGEGGLGKSHTVMTQIRKENLIEDVDFVVIKGYSTPKALYATLFENKNKLVVFDDCDSVLNDPTSLNILKGALDSYDVRTVSWLSKGFIDDGLPSSFNFTGRIIFISNKSLDKVDGAVRSRTLSVDLSMTLEDKIDRMTTILPEILPEYSMADKQEVLDFIDLNKHIATELNIRTLEKLIRVKVSYDSDPMWKEAAKYLLTQS